MSITWHTEQRALADLKPWPDNPRIGTESGHKHLTNSLTKFGLCQDIVCNDDLTIIGGHQRVFALRKMGAATVDVKLPSRYLTDREVRELNARLNRNIAGTWDTERLANEYDMADLKEWGFSEKDFGLGGPTEEDECEKCPTCGKKLRAKKQ